MSDNQKKNSIESIHSYNKQYRALTAHTLKCTALHIPASSALHSTHLQGFSLTVTRTLTAPSTLTPTHNFVKPKPAPHTIMAHVIYVF